MAMSADVRDRSWPRSVSSSPPNAAGVDICAHAAQLVGDLEDVAFADRDGTDPDGVRSTERSIDEAQLAGRCGRARLTAAKKAERNQQARDGEPAAPEREHPVILVSLPWVEPIRPARYKPANLRG